LLELFVIISTYLRVVRRDGMLDEELFLEYSFSLLTAFWGEPGKPDTWRALCSRLTDDELDQEKARLALVEQVWLHAYVLAKALTQAKDRRIYDLAAWMRKLCSVLGRSDVLESLPVSAYRRLWRACFPSAVQFRPATEVKSRLGEVSQWYDEESLLQNIRNWPGARARVSAGTIANEKDVPKLEVSFAFSENDLNRCLRAFALFLAWPHPKSIAWARFTNINPSESPDDLESATFFYRDSSKALVFAVERASGTRYPNWDVSGITVKDLSRVHSIDELRSLQSVEVVVHA
jgi:hypothetical protein